MNRYSEELTAHALVNPFLQIIGSDEEISESAMRVKLITH